MDLKQSPIFWGHLENGWIKFIYSTICRDRLIIDTYFNDAISKNSNDQHNLWNLTTQLSLATSNSSLVLLGKQEEQRLALSFTQFPNLVAAQLALSVLSEKGQRGSCGISSSNIPFRLTFTLPTKPQTKQPITTGYCFLFGDHPSSVLSSFDRRLLWAFLGGAAPVDEDETTTRDDVFGSKVAGILPEKWESPPPKMRAKHEKTCKSDFKFQKWTATWKLLHLIIQPKHNLRLHSLCWGHIPVRFPMFPNLSKIT